MPLTCTAIIVHDDHTYLSATLRSFRPAGPALVFVSRTAWHSSAGDWEACQRVAESEEAEVIVGEWASEDEQRRFVLEELSRREYQFALIPDGDEIIEGRLLAALLDIARNDLADRVAVEWDTYWHSPEYVIRPREGFRPLLMLKVGAVRHEHLRHFEGDRLLVLPASYGIVHHLSYAGPAERMERKLESWSHRDEVVDGWFHRVYMGWRGNVLLRDLHPTHPGNFGFAEHIPINPEVRTALALELAEDPPAPTTPDGWPKISVVIPVYGGEVEIRLCLESLAANRHLLHEVIVIDNASPDGAAAVAEEFDFVRLIRNDENLGFGIASNLGVAASTGDAILFVNSDAIVPVGCIEPLIECLMQAKTVGAVAPLMNFAPNEQGIVPTYSSLTTLGLFSRDIAQSEALDVETDFLAATCLAVRRTTLDEVSEPGYPNLAFDPRFQLGGSEDRDLCYRLRRSGYRLLIASKSYVHHHGSSSFARIKGPRRVLRENENRLQKKWYWDLETGFASHLPGQESGRIQFDENKRPETLRARARARSNLARTSLCMIVRNEERVIRQCLESALHFFAEVIIVDTGSTDRTKEICAEMGVKVIDFEWVDSFAAARNESLRHATMDWIMWLDADDVLPFPTGFTVQDCVIGAPRSLKGIIVPVQFIETDGWGTRVDHVKVFRRLPGLAFDGRIHEQILSSLNEHEGLLTRIDEPVLHAGYDNSPEGQARKFDRDYHLLELELRDKPDSPYIHFCWGMTDHHAGKYEEAAEWFRKSFEKGAGTSTFARKAYALWSQCFEGLEDLKEAIRIAEEGLAAVGSDPELHFVLGRQLSKVKRIDEALAHLEKATQVRNDSVFNSVDITIFGPKTFRLMCDICAQNDRLAEALKWGRKGIETGGSSPTNAIHQVFSVALKAADWPTVQEMQGLIYEQIGPCELWAEMRARMAEVVGGAELGIEELTRVARHHPGSLPIRLVLVRRLLRAGRHAEAEPHLRYLADRGVAEAAFEMGSLAQMHGQIADAIRWLELADDIEPGRPQTLQFLEALRNMST